MKRWMRDFLLTAVFAVTAIVSAEAVEQSTRIRGDIVAFDGQVLTVYRNSGETVRIAVAPAVRIAAVRTIGLDQIRAGSFIGTAAKTDVNGKLTAQEVVVFPESERGTGEGHYAWDLGSHSTMTNANVDAVVAGTLGHELQLSYKGGTKTITVPDDVPIVTFIPAARTDLVVGKKVFVIASKDAGNKLSAQRIVVEKNGVVPPM